MPGYVSLDPSKGVRLAGTSILQCNKGIVGAATAGAAYDTALMGVYIQLNATAATLTIGGMSDSSGAAQNMLLTGSTTVDYFWFPSEPVVNYFAAFTFTPSITNVIWVFTRAYIGPESPIAGGTAYR